MRCAETSEPYKFWDPGNSVSVVYDNNGLERLERLERGFLILRCRLEVSLQYGATSSNVGLSILFISEFEARGVRKVTTGITGLLSAAGLFSGSFDDGLRFPFSTGQPAEMLAYRSSLFRSLKQEVSEKLPQG